MKSVKINLYSFNELSETSKEIAISEHQLFLNSLPLDYENKEGEMVSEYHEHDEDETIDNILANDYYFFSDGSIASVTKYCGNHQRAGETVFKFAGVEYNL